MQEILMQRFDLTYWCTLLQRECERIYIYTHRLTITINNSIFFYYLLLFIDYIYICSSIYIYTHTHTHTHTNNIFSKAETIVNSYCLIFLWKCFIFLLYLFINIYIFLQFFQDSLMNTRKNICLFQINRITIYLK